MNNELAVKLLKIEVHDLRMEIVRLRRKAQEVGSHARRIEKAYRDALQLALWAAAGVPPSRSYAERHGMSQRRWENATALLRQARVLVGHRRWATKDAGLVELKLERARLLATEDEHAYKARHVRHRQK